MKSACASQLIPIHGLTHWEDISSATPPCGSFPCIRQGSAPVYRRCNGDVRFVKYQSCIGFGHSPGYDQKNRIFLDRNLPKALFHPHFRVKSALQSENRLFS
jgi:hypothetical protein